MLGPQWFVSSSSEHYFSASGWKMVDKPPRPVDLISDPLRTTTVHVWASPRAPLLSRAWWLTPFPVWYTAHMVRVSEQLCGSLCISSHYPQSKFLLRFFYPEEIHHWSSDLPTKVASFIELHNISSWKTPTMITESNSCGFTLLRNQFSPRALQGICSLMPFIAACFLPVHPSDIYFGLHAVYAIGWLVELLLFPLSRNGQFPWSCKSDISNVHCSSSRLFP